MSVKERIISIRLLERNKKELLDEIGVTVAVKEKKNISESEKRRRNHERIHVERDS